MTIEDSPIDRTPDLVAKIRALREDAERKMNQFTKVDDFEIRRVMGQRPKSDEKPTEPTIVARKRRAKPSPNQSEEGGHS